MNEFNNEIESTDVVIEPNQSSQSSEPTPIDLTVPAPPPEPQEPAAQEVEVISVAPAETAPTPATKAPRYKKVKPTSKPPKPLAVGRGGGSNRKQIKISRLRRICLDEAESPIERVRAGKLLLGMGASYRTIPILRRLIKLYLKSGDADLAHRTLTLKARLATILKMQGAELPPEIENSEIIIDPDSTDIFKIAMEADPSSSDPWDKAPPLDREEQIRIVACEGSNLRGTALLMAALNGREPTLTNLAKLYNHLTASFDAGGYA